MVHPFTLFTFACASFAASAKQPNIVFILADDLDNDYKQDRLSLMPNLRRLASQGAHFVNHAAVQPVCGPSRSSFLAGRYPHNTGYVCNSDKQSQKEYMPIRNNTVGTWLTAAGYHTSFVGKYINNLEEYWPTGWNHWAGFSSSAGTYNYKNSTPYNITFDRTGTVPQTDTNSYPMTGIHQAEFVGQWGVEQMKVAKAASLPFFIHLTPLMIHYGVCYGPLSDELSHPPTDPYWEKNLSAWGCNTKKGDVCSFSASPCPSDKHAHAFDGFVNPHVPSWNVTESGPVPGPMDLVPVNPYVSNRMDIGFRNRSSALLDLDDLIGVVLDGVEALGELDSTYIIFSSDNGYHLGEHRMPFGKEHPFETDVSLPMYIAGPGVPAGTALLYPTNHIDITATIVELAGATVTGPPLDGLSFASAFRPNPPAPADWRDWQFSEFHCGTDTWRQVRRPLVNTTYTMWCSQDGSLGTQEVFDLMNDPWQVSNIVGTPAGANVSASDSKIAEAMWTCKGDACRNPTPADVQPFYCYNVTGERSEFDP